MVYSQRKIFGILLPPSSLLWGEGEGEGQNLRIELPHIII